MVLLYFLHSILYSTKAVSAGETVLFACVCVCVCVCVCELSRGLPTTRSDPHSKLDTPNYQILENTLVM